MSSLRCQLKKLRFKGKITNEEYELLIKKLDGHDEQIKAEEQEHIVSILFGIDRQMAELVKEILNNEQNTGRKLQ